MFPELLNRPSAEKRLRFLNVVMPANQKAIKNIEHILEKIEEGTYIYDPIHSIGDIKIGYQNVLTRFLAKRKQYEQERERLLKGIEAAAEPIYT